MSVRIARSYIGIFLIAFSFPLDSVAQEVAGARYIRNLVPEIRDLVSSAENTNSQVTGLSGGVQRIIEKSGKIAVRETGDSIILTVNSDILFGFDSARLSGVAESTLVDVAQVLRTAPQRAVSILGHTDSKGSGSYNLKLSDARAESVVTFLVGSGIEASRLKPEGRGESEPAAPNEIDGKDNPNGRAQNRRVEFVLAKE